MRDRTTYWTPRRLIELRTASKRMSPEQLVKHFDRPLPEIQQAQRFESAARRLKLEKRKEVINGKTVSITVYAPEFADGARSLRGYWASNTIL